ncbi:LOW QUALITY PROTEIN: parathyroid hormone-like hormone b [Anableps anableps]
MEETCGEFSKAEVTPKEILNGPNAFGRIISCVFEHICLEFNFLTSGFLWNLTGSVIFGKSMYSLMLVHHWSLAVFLLCFPVTFEGRPADVLINRTRRSVSHAQLLHDKSRSIQEYRRRLWLQKLLEEVHTAGEHTPPVQSRTQSQVLSGNILHQKPQGASKDLLERANMNMMVPHLTQETNKAVAYKEQDLKVPTKRKKKARLGRRRENEKKRRRARSTAGIGP